MTPNRLIAFGLAALVTFVIVQRCIFTVAETENAIIIRLGKPVGVLQDPGLHFKNPIANVVKIDKRNREYDLDVPIEINDVNQEQLKVDAFARYEIVEPLLFYQRFRQGTQADSAILLQAGEGGIRRIMQNGLRQILGEVTIADIVTNLRTELMARIEERMQAEASQFGIKIIDVRIRKADFPDDIADNVYLEMRSERQETAQLIRSQGDRESTRINAEAERKRTEILAEANRESLEIKGAADGDRNAIFNEAYGKDPEFFDFYRSMIAYEEALKQGETTILLSPDSEFLKYFNDVGGKRK
ncbi:MAG: protease modulator HflC [Pseudomonadota bacterium]